MSTWEEHLWSVNHLHYWSFVHKILPFSRGEQLLHKHYQSYKSSLNLVPESTSRNKNKNKQTNNNNKTNKQTKKPTLFNHFKSMLQLDLALTRSGHFNIPTDVSKLDVHSLYFSYLDVIYLEECGFFRDYSFNFHLRFQRKRNKFHLC